jgi:hypothetical protein
LNQIRIRRPSPALAVAILALCVSLVGTAFAGPIAEISNLNKKDTRTVRKISNRIANKRITNRAPGLSVATAQAAIVADTAKSADSAKMADQAANSSHAAKATDSDQLGGTAAGRYVTPSSTLASGDTEVGTFAASTSSGNTATANIEFIPKLPAAPDNSHVVRIPYEGAVNAQCPGPRQAAAGYLCVYEAWRYEMSFSNFHSPFSNSGSFDIAPEGVVLYYAGAASQANVRGNWAYTAP